jgi:hypothetical protein
VAQRLDGLLDVPRSGAARTSTDAQIEALVVATLERAPKNPTHWSRTSMAAAWACPNGAPRTTCGPGQPPCSQREVVSGQVIGSLHRRHRASEFTKFLAKLDTTVPELRGASDLRQLRDPQDPGDCHLARGAPAVPRALHPTSSSRLNQVERWLGLLTDEQLLRDARSPAHAVIAEPPAVRA